MNIRSILPTRLLGILLCIMAVNAAVVWYPDRAEANYPYSTNYRDAYGNLVWTQAAYAPGSVLGRDIYMSAEPGSEATVPSPLAQPKDLFVASDDRIYIADTGNSRIVVMAPDGSFERIITSEGSPLSRPEGVFVDEEMNIYIADTGNQRVAVLSQEGELLHEYTRPDSQFIAASYRFDPTKVIVDKRGFIYVATLGNYRGLIQLDPEGQFQRFYGANEAPFSMVDMLKRFFYTREMYERQYSKLPPSINNMAIDEQGFIYTVSYGVERGSEAGAPLVGMSEGQIKKFNFASKNMLTSEAGTQSFGEVRWPRHDRLPVLADIAVDGYGNMTVVDSAMQFISQYDAYGNLLFFWSGDASPVTSQLGIAKSPAAIDVNSRNELFVLDSSQSLIQVFRLTDFGALVHQANALSVDGKFAEAEPLWREVLGYNAYYTPALLGLAQSAYRKGDFAEARRLFYEGGDQEGYSNAFWQQRIRWFQLHFGTFMNFGLAAIALYIIGKRVLARTGIRLPTPRRLRFRPPLWKEFKHAWFLLRHPIDGFTALRFEQKGSYPGALLWLGLAFVALWMVRRHTSFSFSLAAAQSINVPMLFLQFALVWLVWIVSNYLVSSIMRGEARFRDVFIGSAYALVPLVAVGLPLALVSNVLTQHELSIYQFLSGAVIVWIALLFFWKVQSLQNYSFGETLRNLFLSLVTMALFGVLAFVLFGLFTDLRDFIYSIYQEVSIR